jgi:hypothetical protein
VAVAVVSITTNQTVTGTGGLLAIRLESSRSWTAGTQSLDSTATAAALDGADDVDIEKQMRKMLDVGIIQAFYRAESVKWW